MATQTRPINTYFDALLASYNLVADATVHAAERATRLATIAGAEFTSAQRDNLELARDLSVDQAEPAALFPKYTQFSVKAQDHIATVAKASLQETLDATAEYREIAQKLFESNKKVAEAFVEAAAEFANGQAVADALQAFAPPAEAKKKATAAA